MKRVNTKRVRRKVRSREMRLATGEKKVAPAFADVDRKQFTQRDRFLVRAERARWKEKRLDTKLMERQIQLLRFIWMRTGIDRKMAAGFNANELRILFLRGYVTWRGGDEPELKPTAKGSAFIAEEGKS